MENYSFPSVGHLDYPVGNNIKIAAEFTKAAAYQFIKIREYNNPYPSLNIWCRGSSGAILASLFAVHIHMPNIKIIHVKKPGENSHSGGYHPYTYGDAINVIIDDFVSSGKTLRHIYSQMGALGLPTVNALVIQRLGDRDPEYFSGKLGFVPYYLISDYY